MEVRISATNRQTCEVQTIRFFLPGAVPGLVSDSLPKTCYALLDGLAVPCANRRLHLFAESQQQYPPLFCRVVLGGIEDWIGRALTAAPASAAETESAWVHFRLQAGLQKPLYVEEAHREWFFRMMNLIVPDESGSLSSLCYETCGPLHVCVEGYGVPFVPRSAWVIPDSDADDLVMDQAAACIEVDFPLLLSLRLNETPAAGAEFRRVLDSVASKFRTPARLTVQEGLEAIAVLAPAAALWLAYRLQSGLRPDNCLVPLKEGKVYAGAYAWFCRTKKPPARPPDTDVPVVA